MRSIQVWMTDRFSPIANITTKSESPDQVVPATIVLLNLIPDLPERPRGMFDLDVRLVVTRVVYRMLRSLEDPGLVEAAVRRILPELHSLSLKLELIGSVGYREGVGHKLVTESVASELEMCLGETRCGQRLRRRSSAIVKSSVSFSWRSVRPIRQKRRSSSKTRLASPMQRSCRLEARREARHSAVGP